MKIHEKNKTIICKRIASLLPIIAIIYIVYFFFTLLDNFLGTYIQSKTAARLISVFIPTTPNPTSGMLILVPVDEVIYLDMTVEDGLKLIVSAGAVVPYESSNGMNK